MDSIKVFQSAKRTILAKLQEYVDYSPKGSIDAPIVDLIHYINSLQDYVTTSSCSGRIAIFCHGSNMPESSSDLCCDSQRAEKGNIEDDVAVDRNESSKGAGRWLLASHSQVAIADAKRALENVWPGSSASILLEPFILHVQCRTVEAARELMQIAFQANFRESGIGIGARGKIIVAIRTTSGMLEVPVRVNGVNIADESYIESLIKLCNEKFLENEDRRERFFLSLKAHIKPPSPCQHAEKSSKSSKTSHSLSSVSSDDLSSKNSDSPSTTPFPCDGCSTPFLSRNALFKHIKTCPEAQLLIKERELRQMSGAKEEEMKKAVPPPTYSSLKCDGCETTFQSRNAMFKHVKLCPPALRLKQQRESVSPPLKSESLSDVNSDTKVDANFRENIVGVTAYRGSTDLDRSLALQATSVARSLLNRLRNRAVLAAESSTPVSLSSSDSVDLKNSTRPQRRKGHFSISDRLRAFAVDSEAVLSTSVPCLRRWSHVSSQVGVLAEDFRPLEGEFVAALFGGYVGAGAHGRSRDVVLIEHSTQPDLNSGQTCHLPRVEGEQPAPRVRHAAASISLAVGPVSSAACPLMAVSGGHNGPMRPLDDLWFLTVVRHRPRGTSDDFSSVTGVTMGSKSKGKKGKSMPVQGNEKFTVFWSRSEGPSIGKRYGHSMVTTSLPPASGENVINFGKASPVETVSPLYEIDERTKCNTETVKDPERLKARDAKNRDFFGSEKGLAQEEVLIVFGGRDGHGISFNDILVLVPRVLSSSLNNGLSDVGHESFEIPVYGDVPGPRFGHACVALPGHSSMLVHGGYALPFLPHSDDMTATGVMNNVTQPQIHADAYILSLHRACDGLLMGLWRRVVVSPFSGSARCLPPLFTHTVAVAREGPRTAELHIIGGVHPNPQLVRSRVLVVDLSIPNADSKVTATDAVVRAVVFDAGNDGTGYLELPQLPSSLTEHAEATTVGGFAHSEDNVLHPGLMFSLENQYRRHEIDNAPPSRMPLLARASLLALPNASIASRAQEEIMRLDKLAGELIDLDFQQRHSPESDAIKSALGAYETSELPLLITGGGAVCFAFGSHYSPPLIGSVAVSGTVVEEENGVSQLHSFVEREEAFFYRPSVSPSPCIQNPKKLLECWLDVPTSSVEATKVLLKKLGFFDHSRLIHFNSSGTHSISSSSVMLCDPRVGSPCSSSIPFEISQLTLNSMSEDFILHNPFYESIVSIIRSQGIASGGRSTSGRVKVPITLQSASILLSSLHQRNNTNGEWIQYGATMATEPQCPYCITHTHSLSDSRPSSDLTPAFSNAESQRHVCVLDLIELIFSYCNHHGCAATSSAMTLTQFMKLASSSSGVGSSSVEALRELLHMALQGSTFISISSVSENLRPSSCTPDDKRTAKQSSDLGEEAQVRVEASGLELRPPATIVGGPASLMPLSPTQGLPALKSALRRLFQLVSLCPSTSNESSKTPSFASLQGILGRELSAQEVEAALATLPSKYEIIGAPDVAAVLLPPGALDHPLFMEIDQAVFRKVYLPEAGLNVSPLSDSKVDLTGKDESNYFRSYSRVGDSRKGSNQSYFSSEYMQLIASLSSVVSHSGSRFFKDKLESLSTSQLFESSQRSQFFKLSAFSKVVPIAPFEFDLVSVSSSEASQSNSLSAFEETGYGLRTSTCLEILAKCIRARRVFSANVISTTDTRSSQTRLLRGWLRRGAFTLAPHPLLPQFTLSELAVRSAISSTLGELTPTSSETNLYGICIPTESNPLDLTTNGWIEIKESIERSKLAKILPSIASSSNGVESQISHIPVQPNRYVLDLNRNMFSSGNVTEKQRMRAPPRYGLAVPPGGEIVFDFFVGIGYFSLPLLSATHYSDGTMGGYSKGSSSVHLANILGTAPLSSREKRKGFHVPVSVLQQDEKKKDPSWVVSRIIGCDLNPDALTCFRINAVRNGFEDRAFCVPGDVTALLDNPESVSAAMNLKKSLSVELDLNEDFSFRNIAHRVHLGLIPTSSFAWPLAVQVLSNQGGIIHVHENVPEEILDSTAEMVVSKMVDIVKECGKQYSVECKHMEVVKQYAPRILHVVFDIVFVGY